jgi:hypothetical protein
LQAGLRVFNDESYQEFLARAYRIVTNQAVESDFSKTNIHACLSHFMLVSKNVLFARSILKVLNFRNSRTPFIYCVFDV